MHKQNVVYSYNGRFWWQQKELSTDTCYDIHNCENIKLKETSHKIPHFYGSIFMKYPEKTNLKKKNSKLVVACLGGEEGYKGHDCLTDMEILLGVMKCSKVRVVMFVQVFEYTENY